MRKFKYCVMPNILPRLSRKWYHVSMRILDLFCGAGGAAKGYADAGFEVVGVDINPQPRYPFVFIQDDAIDFLRDLVHRWHAGRFDAIHASPPCQAYSDLQKQSKRDYPDLLAPTRNLLKKIGLPYIIENVETAPLENPVILCGVFFPELRVIRHRGFETNFPLKEPPHLPHPLCFTHDKRKPHYGKLDPYKDYVMVNGGGNCPKDAAEDAMNINWMLKRELNEAIPPSYTRYIGEQLRDYLRNEDLRNGMSWR
jgi:DNA (cytosine-5)-methyltransferase 1